MSKFTDYYGDTEVQGIMTKFVEKFPFVFEGFKPDRLNVIVTKKKKSRKPIRLISVRYPMDVYILKPYIVEVFEELWKKLSVKQKNLAVFHIMCAIPKEGFDETNQYYGKKVRPDIEMYLVEFSAAGGIPNWLDNDNGASDPMEIGQADVQANMPAGKIEEDEDEEEDPIPEVKEKVKRSPVTKEVITGA